MKWCLLTSLLVSFDFSFIYGVNLINLHSSDAVIRDYDYMTVNTKDIFVKESGNEIYYFNEAEAVRITCCKSNVSIEIQINYTLSLKQGTTNKQFMNTVGLYAKLSALDDGATVTCIFFHHIEMKKITLELRHKEHKDLLAFKVNGLIPPRLLYDKRPTIQVYEYEYKYYHNEYLNVVLVTNNDAYTTHNCQLFGLSNMTTFLTQYFRKDRTLNHVTLKFTMSQEETGTSIWCIVQHNKTAEKYKVSLKLNFYAPNYSPFLNFLAMSNILLQTVNGTYTTDNVIVYDAGSEEVFTMCEVYLVIDGVLYASSDTQDLMGQLDQPGRTPAICSTVYGTTYLELVWLDTTQVPGRSDYGPYKEWEGFSLSTVIVVAVLGLAAGAIITVVVYCMRNKESNAIQEANVYEEINYAISDIPKREYDTPYQWQIR